MATTKEILKKIEKLNSQETIKKGVNIISLSQVFLFELSLKRLNKLSIADLSKKFSLDNYLKALISVFSGRKKVDRHTDYLFVNDIFNQSMIQNMRTVQEVYQDDYIELICDKRIKADRSIFIYRYCKPFQYLSDFFSGLKFLSKNKEAIGIISDEFKIKKGLLRLNILDSLFILHCAENFLKAHRSIRHIILNTDVHKISRVLVFLARQQGIKTYVVQHGSTVLEYGYLPINADYMFTWGELSNNWFTERGTSPEKLVATGTPKMDSIKGYNIDKKRSERVQDVLLILNPIGDNNVRHFLNTVFDAEIHKKYRLLIKLHPGSLDNREIVDEVFAGQDVEILKKENTHQLLNSCDVVITTTSTVGNEAIAFYKPLVQAVIDGVNVTMDYENFNCSHMVSGAEELALLLADSDLLYSKMTNYDTFISKYFFKLDGSASERIMSFVN